MNHKTKLKKLTDKVREYRAHLSVAMTFNNESDIKYYSYYLSSWNSQIADIVMQMLEEESKTNTNNTIRFPIGPNVKVTKHTPMNLDGIDRNRSK